MILTKMRPEELKDAVKRNIPIIMAAGVVEYHGPHLPIGTDFLISQHRLYCFIDKGEQT